jgi:hypothetical protein
MAGKLVMQHKCERCGRVWYADPEDTKLELAVALQLKFVLGASVKIEAAWSELCGGCRATVQNLVQGIARDLKHQSSEKPRRRAKKAAGGPEAPSSSTVVPVVPVGRVGTAAPSQSIAAASPGAKHG